MQTTAYRNFKAYYMTNAKDSDLQYYLSTYGPLTVGIDATPLQSYRGGILNAQCRTVNHAVNIVGYVTSGAGAPYYICRNSWGTNWGEVSVGPSYLSHHSSILSRINSFI